MCPTLSHKNILFVPHLFCWDLVTLAVQQLQTTAHLAAMHAEYLPLTFLHKAEPVIKCVSHQQPAAPRSVSTVDVLLRTAASVREAGVATTVPAV